MNRRFFIGTLAAATSALGMGRSIPRKPKYIFLMIGDGMGEGQRQAAERYVCMKYPARDAGLVMNRLPVTGLTTTSEISGKTTDSAAAGTALACGEKTVNGAVGMAGDLKMPLRSVAFVAQDVGMKVGIVTSVPIDHATPASFFSQVPKRGMYYEIDEQIAPSGFDYFAGETLLGRAKSKGKTSPTRLLEEGGYRIITDRVAFDALKKGDSKILVEHDMGYAIDGKQTISLADYTRKGIELLADENGFFMMVEGGKIDWSGHANDLATNIHETLAFDEAVAAVMEFYKQYPDETLVIVTADHETGGLQIKEPVKAMDSVVDAQTSSEGKIASEVSDWKKGGIVTSGQAAERLLKRFGLSNLPKEQLDHIRSAVDSSFWTGESDQRDLEIQKMYGKRNAAVTSCLHSLAVQAGTRWTSFGHTNVPVPTTAAGCRADLFGGEYDNTAIGRRLKELIL